MNDNTIRKTEISDKEVDKAVLSGITIVFTIGRRNNFLLGEG